LSPRFSLAPTIPSPPAPTDLANADGSFLAQRPPALRKKFPLTHPSLYVLLSSAYPFSACFPRQPFVSKFTKGYAYLFPISTPFYCSSISRVGILSDADTRVKTKPFKYYEPAAHALKI